MAKRLIVTLILGFTASISMISSLVLSTTSLVKEIHTAHHAYQLSKTVSISLVIQENIDRGLQDRLNTLEEAVLFMGNQIKIYCEQDLSAVPFTVPLDLHNSLAI